VTSVVTLASFDAGQAQPLLEELIAVYGEIYSDPNDAFHGEGRYRRQITSHMTAPGWRLVTAHTDDGELVGYAYGFPLPASTRWWDGLLTPVPDGFTAEDGHRTFAISEIMVRSPWRRQGIAKELHDEVLAGSPTQRATLLVEPDNAPAQAAYASWGWCKVAELRPGWEHAPLYHALLHGPTP
jgi:ribosomal protein S18 acetylase RimI-like enzyme